MTDGCDSSRFPPDTEEKQKLVGEFFGKNMPNTPATLSVYMSKLVIQDMKNKGGLNYFGELSKSKAGKIYSALRRGQEKGIFVEKVQAGSGSLMNVVFGVRGDGAEARFLEGAERQGMKGLKGHR